MQLVGSGGQLVGREGMAMLRGGGGGGWIYCTKTVATLCNSK